MKHLLPLCAVLLTALVLTGCESVRKAAGQTAQMAQVVIEQNPGLVGNEKDQAQWLAGAKAVTAWTSEIDAADEIAMGQSLALRAFANFGPPHPDAELQGYVSRVGTLVALQSERPSMPYSFAVVQSNDPTALSLPGGYVFVSTGLLRMLGSESELAAVLAHEVSHVALGHGIEIVSRDRRITSLVDFGTTLKEDVGQYRQFIDLVYVKLTTEGYDQGYEAIADEAGTICAYRAGYNPEGLMPFLERARASAQPLAFEAHKTHPDPKVRIEKLRDVLGKLGDYSQMPKVEDRYRREVLSRL